MPNITVREYNPDSGALLGNITSLKFGRVTSGTHSRVKVIDVAFDNVGVVGNVKLGIVSNAGITVNSSPQNVGLDGSSENGNFGIETSITFDASKTSSPLGRHFSGLNGTGNSSDQNNVSIGTRSKTLTDYIYLDIRVAAALSGQGNGSYKIFFDYS